ncbi:MAG: hypothetical protein AAF802_12535 [Planctomycetota bacterium]
MNKRLAMIVLSVTVLSISSGCAPFRNFFFGKGARCGLGSRISAPFQRTTPLATAPAPCQAPAPVHVQPLHQPCAPAPQCGCGPGVYQPTYGPATTGSLYADPYLGSVNGQPIYDDFYARPQESLRPNYSDNGYKVDENGHRIIYEEPLPPGAARQ